MPVSYFPCFTWLVLLLMSLVCLSKGRRGFVIGMGVSFVLLLLLILPFYVPGWILMAQACTGDAAFQFELARWHENHCEELQEWIVWPCEPDVLTGYAWLEKAADQDYPPAVCFLGVRRAIAASICSMDMPQRRR